MCVPLACELGVCLLAFLSSSRCPLFHVMVLCTVGSGWVLALALALALAIALALGPWVSPRPSLSFCYGAGPCREWVSGAHALYLHSAPPIVVSLSNENHGPFVA